MNQLPQLKYQVQEQIIDTNTALLDENNFYHQRHGTPSQLTKRLTYILGDYTKRYPLSTMTEGAAGYDEKSLAMNKAAVELDDPQFTYPVMGKLTKVSVCTSTRYSGGDKPGLGHSPFYLRFNDNYIKRFKVLQSELGIQAYTLEDAVPLPSGEWEIKCQLDPAEATDYCDPTQTYSGVRWVDITVNVAESESRSTETNMVTPGLFKNQMGFQRLGMSWAGNAANKVMKIAMKTDAGETELWLDWFMWQFEQEWLSIAEHQHWYSRYNRLATGEIPLKDALTGKVIPRGSGIIEQIPNKGSFGTLSYNYLATIIGDAFYGQSENAGRVMTLMGGKGFRRDLHRALMAEGATFLQDFGMVADKFVKGEGRSLVLGGFFDAFYHIDGYLIQFKENEVFNTGKVAMGSPLHPITGFPLESHRAVFIDNNSYDGQMNIQAVAQKGRAFMDGVVNGLTPMPKSVAMLIGQSGGAASKYLSTEQDKSSYTRMRSSGIQILKASNCFDLMCTAGQ